MAASLLATLVFLLDRASKIWIDQHMAVHESTPIIPSVLHLTYIQNPGGAFGLFSSYPSLFVVANILILLLLLYIYRISGPHRSRIFSIASGCLIGGALGNSVDRILYGTVIDFLDFRIWPVFNVADIAIVIGAGLLAYYLYQEACQVKED